MDSLELKELIMELLDGLIGYYEVNNQRVPAIRQTPVALTIQRKFGLEVLINKTAISIKAGMNSTKNTWIVSLIQHEGSNTLEVALARFSTLDIFDSCRVLPAYTTRDSKIPEQAVVTLIDSTTIKVRTV